MTKQLEAHIAELQKVLDGPNGKYWAHGPAFKALIAALEQAQQQNNLMNDAMHAAIALTSAGKDLNNWDSCVRRLHEWGGLPDYCIALYVDFIHGEISGNKLLDFGFINDNGAVSASLAEKRIAELEAKLELEREKSRRVMSQNHQLESSHNALRKAMAGIHNTISRDGSYTPLAAIMSAAKRAHEESATVALMEASPLAVKLPEEAIDQVCMAAAEIHNLGLGVNDDKAQFIINRIRNYLENGGTIQPRSPSDGAIYAAYGNQELKAQVEETLRNIGTVEGE